jgi:NAD(P)H-hydrate epimerase
MKRGHLVARRQCGGVAVLDIGLGEYGELTDGAPLLVDEWWVADHVPRIEPSAHKGVRKKLVVIGGAEGMAGAAILAGRAAMRSGIGMVRLLVGAESVRAVQEAEPFALAGAWPPDDATVDEQIVQWADAVVIGPGLGRAPAARALVERALTRWRGPVLLDADALTIFAGDLDVLRGLIGDRAALLTPHPAEFARLMGCTVDDVLARRYDIGAELAERTGATVLLKGVPTVITSADGSFVSATGTPVLAAAGSGDILSGIGGTLLAQMGNALHAGAAAAWIHGRAAEAASVGDQRANNAGVRGLTLDDVLAALGQAWRLSRAPSRYPVLLELPRVGEH